MITFVLLSFYVALIEIAMLHSPPFDLSLVMAREDIGRYWKILEDLATFQMHVSVLYEYKQSRRRICPSLVDRHELSICWTISLYGGTSSINIIFIHMSYFHLRLIHLSKIYQSTFLLIPIIKSLRICSHNIELLYSIYLFKSIITHLYGWEVWSPKTALQKKLTAFDMWT